MMDLHCRFRTSERRVWSSDRGVSVDRIWSLPQAGCVAPEMTATPWETEFRDSRWFTRGWTLQELVAPPIVEFYSREGIRLGDKITLERPMCDATGIPRAALHGTPLSNFTVAEREAWAHTRQTKYEEDMAYSLLGIFGAHMPLIYGEGRQNAQRRLREEVQKIVKGKAYFYVETSHPRAVKR